MVPQFARVVVLTDLSERSNHAVPFAYGLVDDGGEVHLLHVLEYEAKPNPLYAHYTLQDLNLPEERQRVAASVIAKLDKMVPPEAKDRGVRSVTSAVFHGSVAEGILKEVRERKADVVVMSSQGRRSRLEEFVLGSVCQEVTKHCPVPVLVVPSGSR